MAQTTIGFRPAGALDARNAMRVYRGRWTTREAAHLARRAGFGAMPAELEQLSNGSLDAAVAHYLHFPSTTALAAMPEGLTDPVHISRVGDMAGPARAELIRERNSAYRDDLIAMQTWWLERMVQTPAPLQEKMALFWHGHFTTAYREKGVTPALILAQNQLFRSYALGNIQALTQAVSRDPAMLLYLDTARSSKAHPNENYARELMELFTLGIGNYTETDIRESARTFTGYTLDHDRRFRFALNRHDDGNKTFLHHQGNFTGDDIVAIIFEQAACARLFATRLLEFYVYSQPEPELVTAVAALLRMHHYELAPVMDAIFRSEVFYSGRAYRALIKSPVEFVVGVQRLLNVPEINRQTLGTLVRSGQVLFRPPNVKGWDGGASWINSQTLLTRENFAAGIMRAPELREPGSLFDGIAGDAKTAAAQISALVLQSDISAAGLAHICDYLDGRFTAADQTFSIENRADRIRGAFYLALAMPAYQLN